MVEFNTKCNGYFNGTLAIVATGLFSDQIVALGFRNCFKSDTMFPTLLAFYKQILESEWNYGIAEGVRSQKKQLMVNVSGPSCKPIAGTVVFSTSKIASWLVWNRPGWVISVTKLTSNHHMDKSCVSQLKALYQFPPWHIVKSTCQKVLEDITKIPGQSLMLYRVCSRETPSSFVIQSSMFSTFQGFFWRDILSPLGTYMFKCITFDEIKYLNDYRWCDFG